MSIYARPGYWITRVTLLAVGMTFGAYSYQFETMEPIIVSQHDVMVGMASPGGTLQLEVEKHFAGPCKKFLIKRYLWRWKDKTKTSKAAGGEREIAPFDYAADASPFKDDDSFQLDLSLTNVPNTFNPNAGPWYYYTTFTPTCPFWVYPPRDWLASTVIYQTQNAQVQMSPNDAVVKLNESK
jgi:hypothetical protein